MSGNGTSSGTWRTLQPETPVNWKYPRTHWGQALPTRVAELIQNQTHTYAAYNTFTSALKTHRLKVEWWKKVFHANVNEKKANVEILISNKIDFKTKTVARHKEGHYIMINRSVQEEYIITVTIHAPYTGVPKYKKQILTNIKGENWH